MFLSDKLLKIALDATKYKSDVKTQERKEDKAILKMLVLLDTEIINGLDLINNNNYANESLVIRDLTQLIKKINNIWINVFNDYSKKTNLAPFFKKEGFKIYINETEQLIFLSKFLPEK